MEQVVEWCGGKGFCGNTVSVLVADARVAGGAAQPALLATRESLLWLGLQRQGATKANMLAGSWHRCPWTMVGPPAFPAASSPAWTELDLQ